MISSKSLHNLSRENNMEEQKRGLFQGPICYMYIDLLILIMSSNV